MKAGDLISWEYTHHFNSRSRAQRVKHGEYIGKVKHTKRYNGSQLAIVQFYGNKRVSKIPFFEIVPMSTRRKNLYAAQKSICDLNLKLDMPKDDKEICSLAIAALDTELNMRIGIQMRVDIEALVKIEVNARLEAENV